MTQKQLRTFQIITSYIDRSITRKRAAELLHLSERQVSRMKKGVETDGAEFLIHKNSGRKPHNAFSEETRKRIIELFESEEYRDVNIRHFKKLLADFEGISISYSSLYEMLNEAGHKSPKARKHPVKRTRNRQRKEHFGELVQIDATPYEWFDTSEKFSLHGAIDDATGKITGLYMTKNECRFGYFKVMERTVKRFGVPQSLYSDRHTIFRSPKANKLTVEEEINGKQVNLTQFGRAMHDLGIDMIFAQSPMAKGRVERLWETLQSRLPVDLRLRKIDTLEKANDFLLEYIDIFNEEFSVAADGTALTVPLHESCILNEILCVKIPRKTDRAGRFSFNGIHFEVIDEGYPLIPEKKEISVLIHPDYGIRVNYKNRIFRTKRSITDKNQINKPSEKQQSKIKSSVLPHLCYGSDEWKRIWWFESYYESLKFIYDLFLKEPSNPEKHVA